MTGGEVAGGLGNPETVNITPPAQYLEKYIFFTDPTYSTRTSCSCRARTRRARTLPVTLDCIPAPLTGWQAIGTSGYQFTRIDVQVAGAPWATATTGSTPSRAASPFGITVWGFDQYVSYAYPAGASVKPINNVVVPPNAAVSERTV